MHRFTFFEKCGIISLYFLRGYEFMINLYLSFSVIFPIMVYLALGYILKCAKVIDAPSIRKMNGAIFKMFLPILLFLNVYNADVSTAVNTKLIVFAISSIVIMFAVLMIVIPKIEKDHKKISVMIQGIFRSNFVIFGLPVVISLYGAENVGVTAVLIAFVTPVFNALAVVILEIYSGNQVSFKKILKGIIKNPLIISSAIALVFLAFGWRLPSLIEKTMTDISKVATPLSLTLLGGTFTFSSIKGYIKQIIIGVSGKLIISPLIFLTCAILLGFRNVELASLVALYASPVAVSSYVMSQQMGGDETLASHYIVFGSICSIVTVFLFVFVLKQFAFI